MRTVKTDQTGWMPRLIWVLAGCTITLLVLSGRGPYGGRYRASLVWRKIQKIQSQPCMEEDTEPALYGGRYRASLVWRKIQSQPCMEEDTEPALYGGRYRASLVERVSAALLVFSVPQRPSLATVLHTLHIPRTVNQGNFLFVATRIFLCKLSLCDCPCTQVDWSSWKLGVLSTARNECIYWSHGKLSYRSPMISWRLQISEPVIESIKLHLCVRPKQA